MEVHEFEISEGMGSSLTTVVSLMVTLDGLVVSSCFLGFTSCILGFFLYVSIR